MAPKLLIPPVLEVFHLTGLSFSELDQPACSNPRATACHAWAPICRLNSWRWTQPINSLSTFLQCPIAHTSPGRGRQIARTRRVRFARGRGAQAGRARLRGGLPISDQANIFRQQLLGRARAWSVPERPQQHTQGKLTATANHQAQPLLWQLQHPRRAQQVRERDNLNPKR